MRIALTLVGIMVGMPAYAQSSAHLSVHLEVVPAALRVTVTSARVDFGQQHANAGHVVLDPATGAISRKAAGRHQIGQVQVQGHEGMPYAIDVAPVPYLRSSRGTPPVHYALRWARSRDCARGAFQTITHHTTVTGQVGRSGCSALRFGGAISLGSAAEGRYEGQLQVRIVPL